LFVGEIEVVGVDDVLWAFSVGAYGIDWTWVCRVIGGGGGGVGGGYFDRIIGIVII